MSASACERPISAETVEFLRDFAQLDPLDRRGVARLIEVLADEQATGQRFYTDRLMALRATDSPRNGFRALLSEFSDN